MEIDLSKVFSLIAIVISLLTIIMTKNNLKKQLRLNKLEEILEILFFMKAYYSRLFALFMDTEEYINLKLTKENLPDYLIELQKKGKKFTENVNKEIIINKISRLNVLSNAYLPNSKNLKNRIYSISNTYYYMYVYVSTIGETLIKENTIIPKGNQLENFLTKLESDIIKEMELGYKSFDKKLKKKYLENQFLKDLEN